MTTTPPTSMPATAPTAASLAVTSDSELESVKDYVFPDRTSSRSDLPSLVATAQQHQQQQSAPSSSKLKLPFRWKQQQGISSLSGQAAPRPQRMLTGPDVPPPVLFTAATETTERNKRHSSTTSFPAASPPLRTAKSEVHGIAPSAHPPGLIVPGLGSASGSGSADRGSPNPKMTKDNREYSMEVYNSADSPGIVRGREKT
ncbi:hypothetical protein CONPUDRAFT_148026 [Coniophora puteana RWD-64-598 SS2]|uniref:Uncharacterized protein n=1 Tax=Coniophora puteana (strain RWD-64-598) TaxID=741705 RepID=A0A5M3N4Q3_CONPW|nr:uncharacterized protein CONPUDRAFT_148026 [Coniophora puteana RWD-64-598 SS2]EIW85891.1 hypothetical protein CONPUDRAFT_148026 [Coniophora puteana RWD-64-598 SS2]